GKTEQRKSSERFEVRRSPDTCSLRSRSFLFNWRKQASWTSTHSIPFSRQNNESSKDAVHLCLHYLRKHQRHRKPSHWRAEPSCMGHGSTLPQTSQTMSRSFR